MNNFVGLEVELNYPVNYRHFLYLQEQFCLLSLTKLDFALELRLSFWERMKLFVKIKHWKIHALSNQFRL